MEPIDKPFRFTWDFCFVWILLAAPVAFLVWKCDPLAAIWSHLILLLLLSLFATFVIYGPILLVRQIVGSGSRGLLVFRVFVSTVLVIALFFCALSVFGHGRDIPGFWVFVVAGVSTAYLNWRIDGAKK
jgi:hypothetical protein